jgi:DNA-directed RNA polymerase specialized sigma subunit
VPRFAVRVCPAIDWSVAATDGTRQSIAWAKENHEYAKGEIISRRRAAVIQLTKTDGSRVRDAGAIMGLSYQRVAQLTSAGAKDRAP